MRFSLPPFPFLRSTGTGNSSWLLRRNSRRDGLWSSCECHRDTCHSGTREKTRAMKRTRGSSNTLKLRSWKEVQSFSCFESVFSICTICRSPEYRVKADQVWQVFFIFSACQSGGKKLTCNRVTQGFQHFYSGEGVNQKRAG